jgi:hypothetical protein
LIPNNSSRNILDRYIPEGFTYLKSLKLDLNSNKEFKTEKRRRKRNKETHYKARQAKAELAQQRPNPRLGPTQPTIQMLVCVCEVH